MKEFDQPGCYVQCYVTKETDRRRHLKLQQSGRLFLQLCPISIE